MEPEAEASLAAFTEAEPVRVDSKLVARHRWHGRMGLTPLWEDTFRAENGLRLEFERNQVGLVTGFYASIGRTRDVWFQRRE